jgi:F-type H+-transporting ATPase subunit delta
MAVAGAAKRYGQAAFDVARAHDALDHWDNVLSTLSETLEDRESAAFFASPAVSRRVKLETIGRILPGDENQQVRNLVSLLLERDRFDLLPDIAEVFREMLLEARGIVVARVKTAVELTPDELALVQQRLGAILGRTVELRTEVDPEIIGGIVAQIGDDLLDGSVRTQLADLRRRLVRSS